MYSYPYVIPNNKSIYRSKKNPTTYYPVNEMFNPTDNRFFFAPFLVGGLAGTALGYGIANNNQLNNGKGPIYGPLYPIYPPYPTFPTYSNNYYY